MSAPALAVDAIGVLLQSTLDAIVETFQRAGVDLPDRRYIHFGATAVDCEQLTVQLDQTYLGTPGGDPNALQKCNGPRSCSLTVQLWRCAPTPSSRGAAPSVDSMTDAALESARDAWILLDSTSQIDIDAGWATGIIAEVSSIDPQGGFKGLSMSLVIPVP